jgi:hypothetical protein
MNARNVRAAVALSFAAASVFPVVSQAKKEYVTETWWRYTPPPTPTVIVQAPTQVTPVESMFTQHEMQVKIEALEIKERERTVHLDNSYQSRILELERKVAGMQKQITILHAKKEDK